MNSIRNAVETEMWRLIENKTDFSHMETVSGENEKQFCSWYDDATVDYFICYNHYKLPPVIEKISFDDNELNEVIQFYHDNISFVVPHNYQDVVQCICLYLAEKMRNQFIIRINEKLLPKTFIEIL